MPRAASLARQAPGKVVSASRRIDLPACFPGELAAKLLDIGPPGIHTLVLWTKDPGPMLAHRALRRVLERIDSLYLHLTVTGLGSTDVEPRVPPWEQVMRLVPELLRLPGLRPEGVELRYDPLLCLTGPGGRLGNLDPVLFGRIAARAADLGLRTIRTSIITLYPRVLLRLRKLGLRPAPDVLDHAAAFLRDDMAPACTRLSLELLTCANPDLGHRGCVDGARLASLHPRGLPCSLAKDPGQRDACHCTRSLDVGRYFSCPHGCLYCYGNPQDPVDNPRCQQDN